MTVEQMEPQGATDSCDLSLPLYRCGAEAPVGQVAGVDNRLKVPNWNGQSWTRSTAP
jgi:hypothetical protein